MELSQEQVTRLGSLLGAKSTIVFQRELAGGHSGAGVWLVDVQLISWSGSAVLKIEELDAVIGRIKESLAHSKAVDFNSNFAKDHIAKLTFRTSLSVFNPNY